jgi:hypothetical protein
MLEALNRFKPFAFEMAIGALVGLLGLFQLVYGVPNPFTEVETLRKFATSLITIGGTVLASGAFRFVFSERLDRHEKHVLAKLDGIRDNFQATLSEAGKVFAGTITRLQPPGVNSRPQDQYAQYKYLYWRTQDPRRQPVWLRFPELIWTKQILPFLEAETSIELPTSVEPQSYMLAMVELRGCVAVVATRFKPNGAPHGEMAGVYVLAIPIAAGKQLFGWLRHVSMAGDDCISSCILSTEKLDGQDFDRMWLEGEGGGNVEKNFTMQPLMVLAQ